MDRLVPRDDVAYLFLHVPLVTLNRLVHYRLLKGRPVTLRWILVLSAMDIVTRSEHIRSPAALERKA